MSALSDRDTNTQMNTPRSTNGADSMAQIKKPTTTLIGENRTQQQRTLEQRIAEQNNQQTGVYISPSDAIQSPASQKLANFKQRQINKQNMKKPTARSLFSRTVSSTSAASLEGAEDVMTK